MNDQHIRPVPDPPAPEEPEQPASTSPSAKAETRKTMLPRANRPLPTDRMRFETQVEALKALAIVSEFGKRAISGDEMASMMRVAHTTGGLNNAFFADAGLATRESRGRYKPTETANVFARRHSFDATKAGRELGPTLAQSWFYAAVEQRLAMGATTREQMIETLAHAAGATKQRQPQLNSLLDWLQYAGLIDARGAHVTLTNARPQTDEIGDDENEGKGDDDAGSERAGEQTPGGSASAGTTKSQRRSARQDSEVVLSFNVDFTLTVDELSKLKPEQIRALYESIGNVIAIKASVT